MKKPNNNWKELARVPWDVGRDRVLYCRPTPKGNEFKIKVENEKVEYERCGISQS